VVPARGGDLTGLPRVVLPDHVSQVKGLLVVGRLHRERPGTAQLTLALQPVQDLVEVGGAVHLQTIDERRLGQRGLGHHHPGDLRGTGGEEARQHAPDRSQPSVERQLPEQDGALQRHLRQHPVGGEDGARQGQVEPAARLAQRGGRQRQHDALARPRPTGVDDGRPDAVLRLVQRRVRQTDQVDPGQPTPDVRLDLHQAPVDALQRHRPRARQPHQNAA
jgi:hypothetical protein